MDPGKLRIGKLLDRPPRSVEDEAAFTVTNNAGGGEPNSKATASKNGPDKQKFDWIPPNTTAKLVIKRFNQLFPT